MSKNTVNTPIASAPAKSSHRRSAPIPARIGMPTRIRRRATLQAIISGRLRNRSTTAPANSARIGNGMRLAATSRPTATAPAWNVKMASVGRARTVTWLPTSLTVCPAQSRAKSRSRHTARLVGPEALTRPKPRRRSC